MGNKLRYGLSLTQCGLCFLVVLTLLVLARCRGAVEESPTPIPLDVETGTYSQMLVHDGIERSYIVHVPEQVLVGEPLPLLLNLHGTTGTSASQIDYADFRAIADREGIVVIYPQGTELNSFTHWHVDGLFERFGLESTVDDVSFLTTLIEAAVTNYNIDKSRVYSIGHSNGGYMSIQLACQVGDQITAVASVAGSMTPDMFESCQPAQPTPLLQIHGTADDTVQYDGSSWSKPVAEVVDYWVEAHGVGAEPTVVAVAANSETTQESTVTRFQYDSADGEVMVEHIMVEGGGHEWLGQPAYADGSINIDMDTNEMIWDFLSQFDLDDLQ